jgi:hypothetical protein
MKDFPEWTESEEILRELLFAEHSCEGKYGDDGERQCGACQIDFRRDTAAEIERKIGDRNRRRCEAWAADQEFQHRKEGLKHD